MSHTAIVIPCFDEEQRLDVEALLAFAAEHPDVRLLFVDDGSRDGTRAVLEGLRERAGGAISVLALERNVGKGEAVRRGVLQVLGESPSSFGYWDADLSTPLDELAGFRARLDEHPRVQAVLGSRVKLLGRDIRRRALRHYLGRIFATCTSLVLDLPVYDTQCGAKLLRNTRGTRWIFRRPFLSRWLFDVELLARLGLLGRRRTTYDPRVCLYEQPLRRWHDVAGSKIRLRDWVKAAWELGRLGLRYRCARRARPIQ